MHHGGLFFYEVVRESAGGLFGGAVYLLEIVNPLYQGKRQLSKEN